MRDLDAGILEILRKGPTTPDEVAKKLDISWATADGHLLKLVGERKAFLVRIGRVNVYVPAAPTETFRVPEWVKPRPLEKLAEELEEYFPRNLTAAEMIGKERRKA